MAKRRVNLTLPEDLWAELRARVPKRKLSQYIAEATAARLAEEGRAVLRERLKEQYLARTAQDRELAEEFFAAEQETSDQIEA
ncbi:MAG: hypothetical protein ACE5LQ_05745 [Candidatus Bipolaricaulia bacterium]